MDCEYLPAHLHGQLAQAGRAHCFCHEVTALHLDGFEVEVRNALQCDVCTLHLSVARGDLINFVEIMMENALQQTEASDTARSGCAWNEVSGSYETREVEREKRWDKLHR